MRTKVEVLAVAAEGRAEAAAARARAELCCKQSLKHALILTLFGIVCTAVVWFGGLLLTRKHAPGTSQPNIFHLNAIVNDVAHSVFVNKHNVRVLRNP